MKASFLQMAESDIFYVKWGADEDGAMEKLLWLLFVELWTYLFPIIYPPKWAWKSAFYRNNWNAAAGQRRLCLHSKVLGTKVLIKHFKESGLAQDAMLRTQRSRPFPKIVKGLNFGILAKGGPNETFWKPSILQMAENDISYVRWGANDDGAMENWLWLLFVELWAFLSPNFALQSGLGKMLFTETIRMPLRVNGDSDVIESYLEWRSWSSTSRKDA